MMQINVMYKIIYLHTRGRHGRDGMVVEFTTTYTISAYRH
jgi:hypothetical protein